MDTQKEALSRIISTLAKKSEEIQHFLESVNNTLTGLQEESCKVMSELEAELEQLSSALEERGAQLRDIISEENQRKKAELQRQISDGKSALLSCEELLEFANQSLTITNEKDFLVAAKQIKERVTMAPAFRLTTHPMVSENMSQFTVDFSTERARLQQLDFLPVPKAPEMDVSRCLVRDNAITVAWRPVGEADSDGANNGPIERYELEYRKTNRDGTLRAAAEACWEKMDDIRDTQVTISGLKFDSLFIVFRVRAKNKAAAGEFSEPIAMETRAFNFGFDASTAHAELKVQGDTVTWEPQGVKGHDTRLKGRENRSSLRVASSSTISAEAQHRRPIRQQEVEWDARDLLESHTLCWINPFPPCPSVAELKSKCLPVTCDQEMSGGCYYWELRPLADWKSFSVGVAYRGSLGRFDQLGKSSSSWCLYASQWLQSSFSVKHNNRAKALDWPLPQRIGIYCNYDEGDLLFVDVDQLCLLHGFKTKFSQPLVPAFTVWCGGVAITTGLQVPSFVEKILSTNHSLVLSQPISDERLNSVETSESY